MSVCLHLENKQDKLNDAECLHKRRRASIQKLNGNFDLPGWVHFCGAEPRPDCILLLATLLLCPADCLQAEWARTMTRSLATCEHSPPLIWQRIPLRTGEEETQRNTRKTVHGRLSGVFMEHYEAEMHVLKSARCMHLRTCCFAMLLYMIQLHMLDLYTFTLNHKSRYMFGSSCYNSELTFVLSL